LNGLLCLRCAATAPSVNTVSPDFMLCCLRTMRLLLTNQISCESLSRIWVSDTVMRKDILDNAWYQIMSR